MSKLQKVNREIFSIFKTEMNGSEVNSVNSREIYEYLEVSTKYADWIKRTIDKYDFEENEDFTVLKYTLLINY